MIEPASPIEVAEPQGGCLTAIFAGGTPVGAPIVGAVANALGPRWALGIATLSGLAAAGIAVVWLVSSRGMRLGRAPHARFGLRLRFEHNLAHDRALATQEIAIVEGTAKRTS